MYLGFLPALRHTGLRNCWDTEELGPGAAGADRNAFGREPLKLRSDRAGAGAGTGNALGQGARGRLELALVLGQLDRECLTGRSTMRAALAGRPSKLRSDSGRSDMGPGSDRECARARSDQVVFARVLGQGPGPALALAVGQGLGWSLDVWAGTRLGQGICLEDALTGTRLGQGRCLEHARTGKVGQGYLWAGTERSDRECAWKMLGQGRLRQRSDLGQRGGWARNFSRSAAYKQNSMPILPFLAPNSGQGARTGKAVDKAFEQGKL